MGVIQGWGGMVGEEKGKSGKNKEEMLQNRQQEQDCSRDKMEDGQMCCDLPAEVCKSDPSDASRLDKKAKSMTGRSSSVTFPPTAIFSKSCKALQRRHANVGQRCHSGYTSAGPSLCVRGREVCVLFVKMMLREACLCLHLCTSEARHVRKNPKVTLSAGGENVRKITRIY